MEEKNKFQDVSRQNSSREARALTVEETERLKKDDVCVSEFKQNKLEKEAKKNWDLFYKRNSTNFFKDRHWISREFAELLSGASEKVEPSERLTLLEVGCGVGNLVFPILKENPLLFAYACDFSPRAVQFVKENEGYKPDRIKAFQCDLTKDDLIEEIPPESVDLVTMVFVLSAIHPDKMLSSIQNISSVLKPGGMVLFRDYGLNDHAMLRFSKGHKLADSFYVRQDGTRAFFFSLVFLAKLFSDAGFEVVANEYVLRETVNKKEGLCVPRVFVQGKFIKKG
ncbi:tRNA N(3)-cytidine methyltransferase METTL6-like [Apostichopus japonicus]|uniref:tRNA N(3)-cytidine methyltransferase METTL6-like n=1 Tax=Stichopus japonicus TaxID=307972 RepID=UPI003AB2D180